MTFKLGIQYRGLGPYEISSNDDPGLTLTYFMDAKVKFAP